MSDSEPLTGEPVALDLINTRPAGANGREDLLGTPQQLAAWLTLETHRLHGEIRGAATTQADLAPIHAVREHIEAVVRAQLKGIVPPDAALRGLAEPSTPRRPSSSWAGTAPLSRPPPVAPARSASVSPPCCPRPPWTSSLTPRSAGSRSASPTTASSCSSRRTLVGAGARPPAAATAPASPATTTATSPPPQERDERHP
jgi:Putative stress-induced transcription regulator